MDPGVRSHGMKADPWGYLWSKYECFLMSGWWDILYLSCFNIQLWSNSTNGTKLRTNKRTERRKLYTPWHKCRGYNYHRIPTITFSAYCSKPLPDCLFSPYFLPLSALYCSATSTLGNRAVNGFLLKSPGSAILSNRARSQQNIQNHVCPDPNKVWS